MSLTFLQSMKTPETCKHKYALAELSNVIQYDEMGYPLLLCAVQCRRCGHVKQIWNDVPMDYEKSHPGTVVLKWLPQK